MSISPTRSAAASPPARARCWWSMPRQGVEAQTLANVYQAIDANHEIVPVLNKIDLPAAEPERVKQQIEDVIGLDASDAVRSAPRPASTSRACWRPSSRACRRPPAMPTKTLTALLVDSWYDAYLGVVVLVRVHGRPSAQGPAHPHDVERRRPHGGAGRRLHARRWSRSTASGPGEMGYVTAAIKTVADTNVGDTITDDRAPATEALPGFKPSIPVVWCGLYPVDADDFEKLRESRRQAAAERQQLPLRDGDLARRSASAIRCGFLGLLHLEIVQERLSPRIRPRPDRDRALRGLQAPAAPTARMLDLHNPADMPDPERHRRDPGALDQGDDHGARRIPRRGADALQRAPRPSRWS